MLAPSFNFPRPTISDGTDHIRPATLRGLGPDQVLVLVNGKRRHTTALVNVNGTIGRGSTGVDLNAIPAASIERIEILRDGAAAQYGSDAIAGVINVILKSDPVTDAGVQIGSSYTKEENYPEDKHLTDGDLTSIDVSTGRNLTGAGFLHMTAQYTNRGSTNRSLPDPRQQYFTGNPKNSDPRYTNQIHFRQGDAQVNDIGLVLNAALPTMANGMQVYAFGIGGRREGQGAGNWRLPNGDNTVRAIFEDGFLPFINSTVNDYSGTVGVKGLLMRWNYDLSAVYGNNSFKFDITNTNNATLGAASPTEFYAGKLKFGEATANLDLVRAFNVSAFSSPLNVAVGGEYRRDDYGIEAGEPDSYRDGGVKILDGPKVGAQPAPGAQVFPGFQPGDAGDHSRSSVAGYVDFEANVIPRLLLGVAARAEHYSDFGNTTTGKGSARFEVVRGLALRGAISTGFRAPSLSQEFFSATSTNFLNLGAGLVPVEVRTLPVTSGPAKALETREVGQCELRRSGCSGQQPHAHRRLLQHHYRRPHRILRQLYRHRDDELPCIAGVPGSRKRKVLHERHRYAHGRRGCYRTLRSGAQQRRRDQVHRRLQQDKNQGYQCRQHFRSAQITECPVVRQDRARQNRDRPAA
jgi:iron complex outermembrane receptor protein